MFIRRYGNSDFLTGIRAIAILSVFLIHADGFGLGNLGNWASFIVNCGKYGVQIFFVLSGFTIYHQIFNGNISLKEFLLIRISRISIPYYPVLIILFLYNLFGGYQFNYWAKALNNGSISFSNIIAHVLYISPYKENWQNTIIGVEWTLGIEVFYYVLFAFAIFIGFLNTQQKSFIAFGIVSFCTSLIFILLPKIHSINSTFINGFPFKYFYMFFLGALSCLMREKYHQNKLNLKQKRTISDASMLLILIVYGIFVFFAHFQVVNNLIVEAFFALATFFLIIFYDERGAISKILTHRVLLFYGTISYSFYLLHIIVLELFPKIFHQTYILRHSISLFFITTLLSIIWYYIFEMNLYRNIRTLIKKN